MPGPELDASQVLADASQAVLCAHMVQAILPARVVIVLGSRERAIVDHEVVPHGGQIEGAVPLPANLRRQSVIER